ncbi:putative Adenine nucleotide transporter BT1, chloroplastic/amyloplastic/mitochondrial [Nannochloris sp. 'desiccata']|nr:putative Adenine nucleotide transporter BT1, chloroplastic/amyloplastic/mitochondrial [Chlorella desiccata (nom. nud.)]
MLKVSPLPSLPQLRAHQHQGRGSNYRILFKTRKGAKLNPQNWPWVELTETELLASALASPPIHSPSSLTFEFEEFPTSKATNKLELQLIFDHLNRDFKEWAQTLPVAVRRLIAGGISGAVSKTATAPLEAIKLQVVQGHINTLRAARMLYFSGGLGVFFRGNGLDVFRTIPGKGIELATFDALKRVILARTHHKKLENLSYNDRNKDFLVPDAVALALAGAVAGILSTIAVHPLETLRTRLAIGACGGSSSALSISAWSCIVEIVKNEGVGALFRGLDASIMGIMPYAAIRLSTYDALKGAYIRATGDEHLNPRAALVFGAIAGVSSAVATFPLEVARRRMMAGGPYRNVGAALVGIVSKEGVGALFRGVELTIVKQAPQYALGFASYEMAKRALAL